MVSKKPIEERIKDAEEKLKKRQEAAKNQLTELRNLQKAKSKSERAARTRELIELGGLVAIAREITGETLSPKRLMGLLKYGHTASLKNENVGMLSSWDEVGERIFADRTPKSQ